MKKGLILEGGAMRGMFTAGVLDVMMEHDLYPDGAIGVSAGATFGCNIKSRQIGRAIRYNVRYAKDWRYSSIRSLILTGDIYGARFCYDTIPNELDIWDAETFSNNPMEFYVVATDCETGHPVYHKCSDGAEKDIKWMRASASMPMVSNIVKAGGRKLLDGGISDSIPLKYFKHKGYEKNIVVLTQPLGYEKEPFSASKSAMIKTVLKKYPALCDALLRRYKMYNREVQYVLDEENNGNALVIRPKEALNIPSICHDPYEKVRVYLEGRDAAYEKLDAIKEYLQD